MSGAPPIRGRGPWELAFERLRQDRAAIASAVTILLAVVVALAAPLVAHLTGHSPIEQFSETGLSPSGIPVGPGREFWLGTDGLGRDLLVRIAYGARTSLTVAFLATGIELFIGIVLGLAAGFYRGKADTFISRSADIVYALLNPRIRYR